MVPGSKERANKYLDLIIFAWGNKDETVVLIQLKLFKKKKFSWKKED